MNRLVTFYESRLNDPNPPICVDNRAIKIMIVWAWIRHERANKVILDIGSCEILDVVLDTGIPIVPTGVVI